jgi:hypothetical protein
VLHPDATEHTAGSVIHLYRDEELELPHRRSQKIACRLVETKAIRDTVELLLRDPIRTERRDWMDDGRGNGRTHGSKLLCGSGSRELARGTDGNESESRDDVLSLRREASLDPAD